MCQGGVQHAGLQVGAARSKREILRPNLHGPPFWRTMSTLDLAGTKGDSSDWYGISGKWKWLWLQSREESHDKVVIGNGISVDITAKGNI